MDLVNGLHVVITFKNKVFSYGDAYEVLPEIIREMYFAAKLDKPNIPIWTHCPSSREIQLTMMQEHLLVVASIAPNATGEKVHIHLWIYGLQNINMLFDAWWKSFNRNMRKKHYISSSGNPIFIEPVKDGVDQMLRDHDDMHSYYEPLVKYMKRQSNCLMGYFHTKNNPNFLYHYSK